MLSLQKYIMLGKLNIFILLHVIGNIRDSLINAKCTWMKYGYSLYYIDITTSRLQLLHAKTASCFWDISTVHTWTYLNCLAPLMFQWFSKLNGTIWSLCYHFLFFLMPQWLACRWFWMEAHSFYLRNAQYLNLTTFIVFIVSSTMSQSVSYHVIAVMSTVFFVSFLPFLEKDTFWTNKWKSQLRSFYAIKTSS